MLHAKNALKQLLIFFGNKIKMKYLPKKLLQILAVCSKFATISIYKAFSIFPDLSNWIQFILLLFIIHDNEKLEQRLENLFLLIAANLKSNNFAALFQYCLNKRISKLHFNPISKVSILDTKNDTKNGFCILLQTFMFAANLQYA